MRPDVLNERTVDVAAENLSRKLFFDKMVEKNKIKRKKNKKNDSDS